MLEGSKSKGFLREGIQAIVKDHQGNIMIGTHHNLHMAMHIAKEEVRQALIMTIALETTKQGIKSLGILKFILITSILLMMNINNGVENCVDFVVCITIWLLSG